MTGSDSKQPGSSIHYDKKYIMSFISGGIAGITAKSIIAPFDRLKIIFQVK